jgi:hypothetical protein
LGRTEHVDQALETAQDDLNAVKVFQKCEEARVGGGVSRRVDTIGVTATIVAIEATMVTSLIGRSKWDRKGGIKEKGWRTSSILANTAWRMAWLASLVSPCNLVM